MPPLNSSCTSTVDTYLTDSCHKSLFKNLVTESKLVEICKSLKNSHSYDFNYFNVNIMKHIILAIAKPLVYISKKLVVFQLS